VGFVVHRIAAWKINAVFFSDLPVVALQILQESELFMALPVGRTES
jgi:hypothetical protein